MNLDLSSVMLAAFGLSLVLVTLSLVLLRGTPSAEEGYSTGARFFLIALRLAIGWHCFVEGMEKLSTPNWSGEAYLRESMGPLASYFKVVAGDRLIEKLTVKDETFPPALDLEWRKHVAAYANYFELPDDKVQQALDILKKREADALPYLTTASEEMTIISAYPPELKKEMTMADRLKEHQRLVDKVAEAEAKFPTASKDVHAAWKAAKADLAKWRAELKRGLDGETAKLRKSLEELLTSDQKAEASKVPLGPLPVSQWRLLEWSDALVMWSLIVLGGALLLGVCTRCSCFAAGLLILSFYLAMPPLPGWPESPRLEGHYLIINKTLIEVFALFALSFIPTGRWAGLDGIFQWFGRKAPG
jgi:thiosulfate dehydrogenase [quinone] large subunit